MDNKYTKVVYQTEPIGKEKIVLYLTTFDIEAFKKDEKLNKIPTKEIATMIQFDDYDKNMPNFIEIISERLKLVVTNTYENQLKEMADYIEYLKNTKIIPLTSEYSNLKNISNVDDVHCNIVYGNISNCDNIYCNEIKGNVTNCDKIIYKKGVNNE